MIVSGDFDMMKPFFSMYLSILALRKLATNNYFNYVGAFFPETLNFWGTHANGDYGCERTGLADGYTSNPYIMYYWQRGIELSMIILDYYSFTLRRMVIQYENDKVYVLPAWPKEWDVSFKFHAPENTTVECEYRNGEIIKLKVIPEHRKSGIVMSKLN